MEELVYEKGLALWLWV